VPGLLGEQNEIEKRLRDHVPYKKVDRAFPSTTSGICARRRDVYAFAPVPPYAARIECQVKSVKYGAFELGGEILGCVGWEPGVSLSYENFSRGGKVSRAEN
jgi:hypothetical protein